jgi:lipopolysaccharide export LptBFGC system permease protein LptF
MSATAGRNGSDRFQRPNTQTSRQYLDDRHGVEDDRSFGQIVGDLVSHSQELMRGEIAFAKREMAENAKQVGGAAAIGAIALPFALAAVTLLGIALGFGLAEVMRPWIAFLISGVVFLAIAGALALVAKSRAKDARLAPTKAINDTKEDLTWIKAHSA